MARSPSTMAAVLRRMADRTPATRNRHVDLLRAAAIAMVVLGHWLAIVVVHDEGGLRGGNILVALPWTHPATWLFQVMPVFFLVGGYANAASLTSHRRRGGDATGWLLGRTDRLLRPTTAFLTLLAASAALAGLLGADPALIGTATWMSSIPLWFLAVYLAVVCLAPAAHALHRRAGLLVPVVLVVLVGLGDAARMILHTPAAAAANTLLVWLAVHQLGFAWQDGRLRAAPRVALPLAGVGLAAALALTVAGPYPVSMVGVPGQEVQNTSPPSLALVALALTQTGIALSLDGPGNRWLRRRRPWMVVMSANLVILTVFLWHMTAAAITVAALYPTGVLPQPPVDSAAWLLWRLPWLACVALVLTALVAVFGWIEQRVGPSTTGRHVPDGGRARAWGAATAVGLACTLGGLGGIALAADDYHGLFGLPTAAVVAYLLGAAVLRLLRTRLARRL